MTGRTAARIVAVLVVTAFAGLGGLVTYRYLEQNNRSATAALKLVSALDASLERGDFRKAAQDLSQAKVDRLSASLSLRLLKRARTYGLMTGDFGPLAKMSARVFARYPNRSDLAFVRSWALLRTGGAKEAVRLLSGLQERKPLPENLQEMLLLATLSEGGPADIRKPTDDVGHLLAVLSGRDIPSLELAEGVTEDPRLMVNVALVKAGEGRYADAVTEAPPAVIAAVPEPFALIAYDDGDWADAYRFLASVERMHGFLTPYLTALRGDSAWLTDRPQDARGLWEDAAARGEWKALVNLLLVDPEADPLETAQTLLSAHADSVEALEGAAAIFSRAGLDAKALACYNAILVLEPDHLAANVGALQLSREGRGPEGVKGLLWTLLHRVEDRRSTALYAQWYFLGMEDNRSVVELDGILASYDDPVRDDPRYMIMLAAAMTLEGRTETGSRETGELLDAAGNAKALSWDLSYDLGILRLSRYEWDAARTLFAESAAKAPPGMRAWGYLGSARLSKERRDRAEALRFARMASADDPKNLTVQLLIRNLERNE